MNVEESPGFSRGRGFKAMVKLEYIVEEGYHGKIIEIRQEVLNFALEMERVLKDNDDKDGWDDMEVNSIIKRIHEEVAELQEYLTLYNHPQDDRNKVREMQLEQMYHEAIDITNFCMFLCHNYPKKE